MLLRLEPLTEHPNENTKKSVIFVLIQHFIIGVEADIKVTFSIGFYGNIANTLAGNPEPFLGFGNDAITSAPDSGTLSKLVSSSI